MRELREHKRMLMKLESFAMAAAAAAAGERESDLFFLHLGPSATRGQCALIRTLRGILQIKLV